VCPVLSLSESGSGETLRSKRLYAATADGRVVGGAKT